MVTLGSPFSGDPHQNNVWRLYEWSRGTRSIAADPACDGQAAGADAGLLVAPGRNLAPRSARGLDDERDKAVEMRCTHMAFGVSGASRRHVATRDRGVLGRARRARVAPLTLARESRDKEQKQNKNVVSCVARGFSLVAGGAVSARSARPKRHQLPGHWLASAGMCRFRTSPTLSELFAAHPRDGGWAGFLLAQVDTEKPLLWVQDRMAILESGRIHPPGLPSQNLIHVETRDARDALWAMEEGLRCPALSCCHRRDLGRPASARLHRDAAACGRLGAVGVPCWLVRLGGTANLSGARMRWRIASAPSLPTSSIRARRDSGLGRRAVPRARSRRAAGPSRMKRIAFHLVAGTGDRALGEERRSRA